MADIKKPDRQTGEKDFPYFRGLWNSIVIALLAASFIPLILIGGGMYSYATSGLKQKTLASLRKEVLNHKEAIDKFLTERTLNLNLLASNMGLKTLTRPGALEKVFESLLREMPCFTDLGIIDHRGQHLAYIGPYNLISRNYRDSEWFKAVMANNIFISDVFLGFRKAPHFVIAVKQISDEGVWIIRATIDTGYFDDIVFQVTGEGTGDAFMVNSSGIFQTTPRFSGRLMDQSEFKDLERFENVRLQEKQDMLYMMTWLEKVPWVCVAQFDRKEIYQPLRRARNLGVFVLALGTIIIVLTVILTTNYLVSRLETKRRNIRFLDQQLRHTSRVASSVQLSSGRLQEIRDALGNIDVATKWMEDLIEKGLGREENVNGIKKSLSQIRQEVSRIDKTTDTFFKATRRPLPIIKDIMVNDILDDILDIMDRELHFNNIKVERQYRDPLPAIRSDPSQLHQVFQNLVLNAVSAIQKEGSVILTTEADEEGITVTVTDDGPGIPKEYMEKIFDPLFSTRPDGAGLGLSICATILDKLGGHISVESEPGQGAAFKVRLPFQFKASNT